MDVDEALKLMDFSIRSLRNMKGEDKNKRKAGKYTNINKLYNSKRW
jgi:hypothetical protein